MDKSMKGGYFRESPARDQFYRVEAFFGYLIIFHSNIMKIYR